jgi:hypothetical protein
LGGNLEIPAWNDRRRPVTDLLPWV